MIEQIIAITLMNLRALPQRIGASSVIVIGIAGVVAVLVSVLAMATGFRETMARSGRADRAIVLRGGSQTELSSTLARDAVLTILDAPGVKHDTDGKPIGEAEALVIVSLPTRADGTEANVSFRGIGAKAMALRPEIHLTQGRLFAPAVREVIVGSAAVKQFKGLELGSRIAFRDSDWTVVGIFESNGDSHESEIWADAETLLSAYRRNLFQSVTAMLDSPEAFDRFKDALTTNPQLTVDVKRENDYFATMSKQLNDILFFFAYFVGGIMAVGALFGALNAMYTAVSSRAQEIATLRAIGFGAVPVVVSVFTEALLLSLLGGAIGSSLAWGFFNGNAVNTLSGNFTQLVFHLTVSPALLALGIAWACAIGVLGGLFPAVRAARAPVAEALRAG
jgi:putative ABC transport system permease protein